MPQKNARVNIPTDPTQLLVLAGKIQAKNDALGDASPLKGLEDAPLFAPAAARATAQDTAADDFAKKAETAMGARNADLPTVREGVHARRGALLAKGEGLGLQMDELAIDAAEKDRLRAAIAVFIDDFRDILLGYWVPHQPADPRLAVLGV